MCAALARPTMRAMAAIEIEHLHKSYGDVVAVDDVSLSVEPGEIFGIIGVNGAGKTTTVECVSGLTRPDRGRHRGPRPGPDARAGRDPPPRRRPAAGELAA